MSSVDFYEKNMKIYSYGLLYSMLFVLVELAWHHLHLGDPYLATMQCFYTFLAHE